MTKTALRRIIELLERAPAAMTQHQIAEATGILFATVQGSISDMRDAQTITMVGTTPRAPGAGGQARKLWALTSRANEVEVPTGRDVTRIATVTAIDTSDESGRPGDDLQPQRLVETVRGVAGFYCRARSEFVTFGDCIDSYTDATALDRKSPCRKCPDGAHRRDVYASGEGVRA